jgi:hypothetical protein
MSCIIRIDLIPHPHDAEQIKYSVQCALENYGIINNIISITTDNATNNMSGITLFKDYLKEELFIEKEIYHLSCFGHVLNLCVQEWHKNNCRFIKRFEKFMLIYENFF